MEDILVGILFVIAAALLKNTQKMKNERAVQAYEAMRKSTDGLSRANAARIRQEEMKLERPKPVASAAVKNAVTPEPVVKVREEVHHHEGKPDIPCPAMEREMPRIKAKKKTEASAPSIPGLNLSFDRKTVLQGFVMSEILNRPRPGMRR